MSNDPNEEVAKNGEPLALPDNYELKAPKPVAEEKDGLGTALDKEKRGDIERRKLDTNELLDLERRIETVLEQTHIDKGVQLNKLLPLYRAKEHLRKLRVDLQEKTPPHQGDIEFWESFRSGNEAYDIFQSLETKLNEAQRLIDLTETKEMIESIGLETIQEIYLKASGARSKLTPLLQGMERTMIRDPDDQMGVVHLHLACKKAETFADEYRQNPDTALPLIKVERELIENYALRRGRAYEIMTGMGIPGIEESELDFQLVENRREAPPSIPSTPKKPQGEKPPSPEEIRVDKEKNNVLFRPTTEQVYVDEEYAKFNELAGANVDLQTLRRLVPNFQDMEKDPAKQMFVLNNLKHVWYKHIEDEAEKRRNEYIGQGNWWGNKIRRSFHKEGRVVKHRKDIGKERLRVENFTEEIKNLIYIANEGPDLSLEKKQGKEWEEGYEVVGEYLSKEFLASKKHNIPMAKIAEFNRIASHFAAQPTELDAIYLGKSAKRDYLRVQKQYERAKAEILERLGGSEESLSDGERRKREPEAMMLMNNLDFQVRMHQTLIQHPEVESELRKFNEANHLKAAFAAGGYIGAGVGLTRAALKFGVRAKPVVDWVGTYGSIAAGAIISGTISGIYGFYKGGKQGQQDLLKRDRAIGEGKKTHNRLVISPEKRKKLKDNLEKVQEKIKEIGDKDPKKRKKFEVRAEELKLELKSERSTDRNFATSENLKEKIEKLQGKINAVEESIQHFSKKDPNKVPELEATREQLKDALQARIYFTRRKLQDETIIFGNQKEGLAKKFDLMQTIAQAKVDMHMGEGSLLRGAVKGTYNKETGKVEGRHRRTRIEALNLLMEKDADIIRAERKKYIWAQRDKGVALGLAGAAIGYGTVEAAREFLPMDKIGHALVGARDYLSIEGGKITHTMGDFIHGHLAAYTKLHGQKAGEVIGNHLVESVKAGASAEVLNHDILTLYDPGAAGEASFTPPELHSNYDPENNSTQKFNDIVKDVLPKDYEEPFFHKNLDTLYPHRTFVESHPQAEGFGQGVKNVNIKGLGAVRPTPSPTEVAPHSEIPEKITPPTSTKIPVQKMESHSTLLSSSQRDLLPNARMTPELQRKFPLLTYHIRENLKELNYHGKMDAMSVKRWAEMYGRNLLKDPAIRTELLQANPHFTVDSRGEFVIGSDPSSAIPEAIQPKTEVPRVTKKIIPTTTPEEMEDLTRPEPSVTLSPSTPPTVQPTPSFPQEPSAITRPSPSLGDIHKVPGTQEFVQPSGPVNHPEVQPPSVAVESTMEIKRSIAERNHLPIEAVNDLSSYITKNRESLYGPLKKILDGNLKMPGDEKANVLFNLITSNKYMGLDSEPYEFMGIPKGTNLWQMPPGIKINYVANFNSSDAFLENAIRSIQTMSIEEKECALYLYDDENRQAIMEEMAKHTDLGELTKETLMKVIKKVIGK